MHVLLVHFPIALLAFTPVMILAAIVFRKWGRQFAAAAGFVLVAGTIAAQVAVLSGEAAEEFAEDMGIKADQEAYELMEEHGEAGERVRNIYLVLSVLYWAYLGITGLGRRSLPLGADVAALLLFFLLTAGGALAVANTGHMGGLLVHTHGMLAPMDAEAAAAAAAAAEEAGSSAEPEAEEAENSEGEE
jgi:uncharacterized membrane protein